jgi:transcriptional regulator with XRE-family HTH domain
VTDFAEKFKAARKAAGLTQQGMEDQMQIPRRTVQDWEKGIMTPPPYVQALVLEKLAGMNPDNVGTWEWFEEWNPSTPEHPRECEACGWRCGKCKTALEDVVGGYWDDPEEKPNLTFCPACGVRMKELESMKEESPHEAFLEKMKHQLDEARREDLPRVSEMSLEELRKRLDAGESPADIFKVPKYD